jgi:hypothetical protein
MAAVVQVGRVRRAEGEWRSLLARFSMSGVTIKAFCRRERISEASFYRWRTILNGNQDDGVGVREDTAAAFVDLGALESVSSAKPKLDLRLDLGDGLILHLVRH